MSVSLFDRADRSARELGLGLLLGVLVGLPTGIGAELRGVDSAEPLAAATAVVPEGRSEGCECGSYLGLVHAPLYHVSETVSKITLDTDAEVWYNGFVG